VPDEFDLRDKTNRDVVGGALRTTYELDAPMPDYLQSLMEQLQQRLDERAAGACPGDGPIDRLEGQAAD
jgi:hypothetical protein